MQINEVNVFYYHARERRTKTDDSGFVIYLSNILLHTMERRGYVFLHNLDIIFLKESLFTVEIVFRTAKGHRLDLLATIRRLSGAKTFEMLSRI